MKVWSLLAAVAVGAQLPAFPAAADIQKFYIRNRGAVAIADIRISPDYSNIWGDDVLGSRALPPGGDYLLDMSGFGAHCIFDLRIEDETGAVEIYQADLCEVLYFDVPR